MNDRTLWTLAFTLLVVLTIAPGRAAAESSAVDQLQLQRERALQAYENLDMDRAVQILQDAIQLARIEGISGEPLARLEVDLGTVLVLGLNRLADGREQLLAARRESRDVAPDPMLSTPLLDQLWRDVVSQVEQEESARRHEPESNQQETAPPVFGQGRVIVREVREQLPDHAIPIYVEVEQVQDLRRVLLAYRGAGQRRFLSIEMEPYGDGFAGRIPCHRVRPPRVEYFVRVLDSRGEEIASSGSEDDPHVVEVREELEGREPTLPGGEPEPICSEDRESEQQEERSLPGSDRRLMFFEVGLGTGAGIPIAQERERNSCFSDEVGGTVFDLIDINSSLAWTELVLAPALGFHLRENLTLGVRGRLQFGGAKFPETPVSGGGLAELRFFPLMGDLVRLSLGLGLGGGVIVHPITLEGATNCGRTYYRKAGYFLGEVGLGLLIDVHRAVALSFRFDLYFAAPVMAVQGDITVGLSFTIPRR